MATATEKASISFREFLEGTPPGTLSAFTDLCGDSVYQPDGQWLAPLCKPEISLHCETEGTCGGNRLFNTNSSFMFGINESKLLFVTYTCKNCSKVQKTFALRVRIGADQRAGTAIKFGEIPAFGPPTPARVISL